MNFIKKWIKILGINVRGFFKHPIQYSKGYVKDFKECDTKGKVKKVALLVLGIYACYRLFIVVFAITIAFAMVGGSSYEILSGRFRDKYGRDPENEYEMYHDRDITY